MNPNHALSTVGIFSQNLMDAEDELQSAKSSGNLQALGSAEGRVLRWKRQLARLDPHGAGHAHLATLTEGERGKTLGQLSPMPV